MKMLPRAQRLTRFLDHYHGCDDCGRLPLDVDDADEGELCEVALYRFEQLDQVDQVGLVRLAALHVLVGVEGDFEDDDDDGGGKVLQLDEVRQAAEGS